VKFCSAKAVQGELLVRSRLKSRFLVPLWGHFPIDQPPFECALVFPKVEHLDVTKRKQPGSPFINELSYIRQLLRVLHK
jgi:hypothetical protein